MRGRGYAGDGYGGILVSGIVHFYIVPTMATEPDNNALSIQPRSYTNGAGKNVLENTLLQIPLFLIYHL